MLEVRDLVTVFHTDHGRVRAVDGLSFSLEKGKTLGIVGESGSGKSVTNLSIMRLLQEPPAEIRHGSVLLDGRELLDLSEAEMRRIRGKEIAMVFQDPMTSLNPFLRVGRQLTEVLELHLGMRGKAAADKATAMLERVGIPDAASRMAAYPHELSGGMRQRVMIAMALLCDPRVLIADEPTTALDVTIQAQILELLSELVRETDTALILVTHDLGVVAGTADEVVVMYAGMMMEEGPTESVFANTSHPYTLGLLLSIPRMQDRPRARLHTIEGLPPDAMIRREGCPFAPRCPFSTAMCEKLMPPPREVTPGHVVRCHIEVGPDDTGAFKPVS